MAKSSPSIDSTFLHLRHATPEEILGEVQSTASGVNLSTVYRTLEVLEQVGLVTHAHIGHGAPTYHVVDDTPHIHLVCSRMKKSLFVISGDLYNATIRNIYRTNSLHEIFLFSQRISIMPSNILINN